MLRTCMQKLYLFVLLYFIISGMGYGQDTAAIKKSSSDSAALKDLMTLFNSDDIAYSYVSVNMGMSNRLYSSHNNSLDSKQSITNSLIYTPSVGYFHKSGFSLSAGVNFMKEDSAGFVENQFSLTPAFDLTNNKNVGFGISYSHYFVRDIFSGFSSPIQNDLYTYVTYKKSWIEPGISFGYSTGKFKEVFKLKTPTGRTFIDTGTYRISTFSMMASVSHSFTWDDVAKKNDGLVFTPSIQLNMSSDSTKSISHTISKADLRELRILATNLRAEFKKLGLKPKFQKLQGSNSFKVQSIGLNLNASYSLGSFSIEPQLYLDYYLQKTDDKKLTYFPSLSIGYTF